MKCVKCNKTIGDEDIYCGYCGINQKNFIKYLDKVSQKIHKERDYIYNSNIQLAKRKLKQLERDKKNEIERIENSRWVIINENFKYNKTEGVVLINNERYKFNEIEDAKIVRRDSFRVVTTSTGNSKKHISVGKAIVGGTLFGPIGAITGGAMGKRMSSENTISNSLPVCNYIGVAINISGFSSEIVILNKTVDQDSNIYNEKLKEAQSIVDNLRILSTCQVPKNWLKPEEEPSVLEYESKIKCATNDLQKAIEDIPNYDIPDSYYE